ncbi:predicted protein [Naegleria gruberi]|uniref:Predicted protein n=1 Tax=Naegleria gruberi TaxID=5762 RepID=D2VT08_NAEGR|nr:uncharacterized protein NAEGRDRAFT_72131 [Naegleria gruberi]EFC40000.1 predicted protein [Naegleria gruberi]|eukprot:XP_002672744.1 predicted protein [Naegleria gruberi strain NEG-M]
MLKTSNRLSSLVSCQALKEAINKTSNIKIIDGSWHMPAMKRNGYEEYLKEHIPNARFFDIDGLSDQNTDLPHMFPSVELFEKSITEMGIENTDQIVVYDTAFTSAFRVWYTFKVFGHEGKVSLLDGGLTKWKLLGYPIESGKPNITPSSHPYKAKYQSDFVARMDEILDNLNNQKSYIVDARSAERFNGTQPEPRPNLKSGHIPNSFNIPFPTLVNPEDKTFKTDEEILKLFQNSGLNIQYINDKIVIDKPIIGSCGSGVTACALLYSLNLLGVSLDKLRIYDGSFSEYGKESFTNPVSQRK